jgi:hypothetical protein
MRGVLDTFFCCFVVKLVEINHSDRLDGLAPACAAQLIIFHPIENHHDQDACVQYE